MATLNDLLQPASADTLLQTLITRLQATGAFPLNDWESGGVARTLLEVEAATLADAYQMAVGIAAGGYLQTAPGGWLDLLVASQYNLTRNSSVFAVDVLTLSNSSTTAYTLQPGDAWVQSAGGLRFNSLDGGVLPAGGALSVRVQAESPGSAYNLPRSTLTTLLTPLPGVTCNNTQAMNTAGVDAESDSAFAARARLRWAELGGGATAAAYKYWALTSDPTITQVLVLDQHPRGQGTVDVVVWGAGGLGADAVANANSFIQARRPVTADVQVYSAQPLSLPVQMEVYLDGTVAQSTVLAQITASFAAFQQAAPIGSTVYAAKLIELAMLPAGVKNVVLQAPTGDTVLSSASGAAQAVELVPQVTFA